MQMAAVSGGSGLPPAGTTESTAATFNHEARTKRTRKAFVDQMHSVMNELGPVIEEANAKECGSEHAQRNYAKYADENPWYVRKAEESSTCR